MLIYIYIFGSIIYVKGGPAIIYRKGLTYNQYLIPTNWELGEKQSQYMDIYIYYLTHHLFL